MYDNGDAVIVPIDAEYSLKIMGKTLRFIEHLA